MLRIKEKRIEKKLSQTEFAKRISVSPKVVNNWERGRAWPRADALPGIASVLSCSIDDLYEEEKFVS